MALLLKGILLSIVLIFTASTSLNAQNTLRISVTESESGEPLTSVNIYIPDTQTGTATDEKGYAELSGIPDGQHEIKISFLGYGEESLIVNFPSDNLKLFNVKLEHEAEELEEVAVTSTRYSRLAVNTPTRVEVVAGEEINEKISMDPSNISMLLSETTGIQVQQTSAAIVNNTFRIQGLEGRYTQLLQDGFPLYSGFSGSLSIMQIPPLDLRQVEIIKGSSSTLYGGGAIAGLINLITKKPAEHRELSFLINGTSALGLDLSGYYSNKSQKNGITFLATRNTQRIYDNNDDDFSDLPEVERYSLSPKVFFYFSEYTTLMMGVSYIREERTGGYIPSVKNESTDVEGYTEKNLSNRFSSQVHYSSRLNSKSTLDIKNSVSFFKRELNQGNGFTGKQIATFTEAAFHRDDDNLDWIAGLNLVTDDFQDLTSFTSTTGSTFLFEERSYADVVSGAFLQGVYGFSDNVILEAGLRTDYTSEYGFFALPRASMLFKFTHELSSRVGAGLGYKLPTLFTEEAEELGFKYILPLDKNSLEAERSYGANFDINFTTILFNELTFTLNNLFFYTRINDPLMLKYESATETPYYYYVTSEGFVDTKGIETNLRLSWNHFKFFAGYAYTDANFNMNSAKEDIPLTARHKLGLILFYEEHDNFRIGLEGYYTGEQTLSDGSTGRSYWINGIMLEKKLGMISLFLNFENFLDTRQSRFGPMYSGTIQSPDFAEIYAPTDGRIINGGIKINF